MKRLIQNRRSAGWNLIEIIVAVAIGASIAAAGVAAYQGEAQKASVAKAKSFLADLETKKQQAVTTFTNGETGAPSAATTLAQIRVQGQPSSGNVASDAITLGFTAVNYGRVDLVTTLSDGTTSISPGSPGWVQLKNNQYVSANTISTASPTALTTGASFK